MVDGRDSHCRYRLFFLKGISWDYNVITAFDNLVDELLDRAEQLRTLSGCFCWLIWLFKFKFNLV